MAGQGPYHTKGGRQTDTNCLLIEQQTSSTSGAKHSPVFTKLADHVTMYWVCDVLGVYLSVLRLTKYFSIYYVALLPKNKILIKKNSHKNI